ncbi:zinc finger domain-containing protein [Actinosynnema sp. CS-041913]|uniref:zinc finger domain-containing protein n=1 Tax=Actinosynnema sp. CS-041913 TaxID=3239917 RepID=UPI003D8F39B2
MTVPTLTRSEVRALLWHYRIAGEGQPIAEDVVTAWWRELRDRTAAQCHAALASINPQRVRHTTPAEVAKLAASAPVDGATGSARPPLPRTPADIARERARFANAGQRGIRAVYAAMGWQRHPDTDLAGTVACPFCRAQTGQVCRPLVRTRAGKREQRDPTTRMHPSRLAKARADKATRTTTRGGSNPPTPQGASA